MPLGMSFPKLDGDRGRLEVEWLYQFVQSGDHSRRRDSGNRRYIISAEHATTLGADQTNLALWTLTRTLDAVTTLNHISLQTDRTRATMQFEEEPASVA